MRKKKEKITTIEISPGVVVSLGAFIHYYLDGWRYGYLESIRGTTVRIKPIGPMYAAEPRSVNVSSTDIQVP